jgi:hypothetical protein
MNDSTRQHGHVDPGPEELVALRRILSAALDPVASVHELHLLSGEQRDRVVALEREAEANGAASGVMPFENEGVIEALAADLVFAALTGPMVGTPPRPWTIMLDDDDQVIGEWLPAERIEEVKLGGRCIFLSSDFVMYKDRRPRGKGRFIMPYMPLEVPDQQSGPSGADDEDSAGDFAVRRIGLCGVGCPSPPADTYIRSLLGEPGSEIATLVLGACWADAPTDGAERRR